MLPADLADKIIRWEYNSAAQEAGFQPDRATIQYADIDLATYHAVAEGINNAAAFDPVSIVVMIDTIPVELFAGEVVDWRLEERFDHGVRSTVGVLEAQDLRGRLLRTAGPLVVFGSSTRQFGQLATGGRTFAEVVAHCAAVCGISLTLDATLDYVIPVSMVGGTGPLATVLTNLLQPWQQRRAVIADVVRTGSSSFRIQRRIHTPTVADITVPPEATKMRSYRRSLVDPPPAVETIGGELGGDQPAGDGGCGDCGSHSSSSSEGPEGTSHTSTTIVCDANCNATLEVTESDTTDADGEDHSTSSLTFYAYAGVGPCGQLMLSSRSSTTWTDGYLSSTELTSYFYSSDGRNIGHHTQRAEYTPADVLPIRRSSEIYTVTPAGAGSIKSLTRTEVGESGDPVVFQATDFSPGDTDAQPECPPDSTAIVVVNPPVEYLIEVSLEFPLHPFVHAGLVLEVGGPAPVTVASMFYLTQVSASWDREGGHSMQAAGEHWLP